MNAWNCSQIIERALAQLPGAILKFSRSSNREISSTFPLLTSAAQSLRTTYSGLCGAERQTAGSPAPSTVRCQGSSAARRFVRLVGTTSLRPLIRPPSSYEDRPMLVLARCLNESIIIAKEVRVTVLTIAPNRIELGIDAASHISVDREEVHLRKHAAVTAKRARVTDG